MKKMLFVLSVLCVVVLIFTSCSGGGNTLPISLDKVPGYLQFVYPDSTRAVFEAYLVTDPESFDRINLDAYKRNFETLLDLEALKNDFDMQNDEYYLVVYGHSVNSIPAERELMNYPFATFLYSRKLVLTDTAVQEGVNINLEDFPDQYIVNGTKLDGTDFTQQEAYVQISFNISESRCCQTRKMPVAEKIYLSVEETINSIALIGFTDSGNYVLGKSFLENGTSGRGEVSALNLSYDDGKHYTLNIGNEIKNFGINSHVWQWGNGYLSSIGGPDVSGEYYPMHSADCYISDDFHCSYDLTSWAGNTSEGLTARYRLRLENNEIDDGETLDYTFDNVEIADLEEYFSGYGAHNNYTRWMGDLLALDGQSDKTRFDINYEGDVDGVWQQKRAFKLEIADPDGTLMDTVVENNVCDFKFNTNKTGTYHATLTVDTNEVDLQSVFSFDIQ